MKLNNFLFIVPLTPKTMLTEERKILQDLCFSTLLKQNYTNWKAVIIGNYLPELLKDSKHIYWLNFEGSKGEKLPKVLDYIIEKKLDYDYLVRLDDDDIFNPNKLNELKYEEFDICVDKQQYFWNNETKQISYRTWHWFANTTIQKKEYALSRWHDPVKKNSKESYIIDTNHGHIHFYYKGRKILFSDSNSPLYLRSINNSSRTMSDASDKEEYIHSFGNWSNNNLTNFIFLGKTNAKVEQGFISKIKNLIFEIRSRLSYKKVVIIIDS